MSFSERREAEVRELEKREREREREAKMERERLEKQKAAEQAVHRHFEESLRLAQHKVSQAYCVLPIGNYIYKFTSPLHLLLIPYPPFSLPQVPL